MAWHATDNLRLYLERAVLPEMIHSVNAPLVGHEAGFNQLTIRTERWRLLESVHRIKGAWFSLSVGSFIGAYVRDYPMDADVEDHESGERLSVSCDWFNILPLSLARPEGTDRVSSLDSVMAYVDQFPLETAQRVVHLLFPQTSHWHLLADNKDEPDPELFQYFTWSAHPVYAKAYDGPENAVVIAVQPPWVLTSQDLQNFVNYDSCPEYESQGRINPLEAKDKLWAKLWDTCARNNCHYFVLTNYNEWVFGGFSDQWTAGFASQVKPYNAYGGTERTIVESLVYWFASSLRISGGWKPARVPESLAPTPVIPPDANLKAISSRPHLMNDLIMFNTNPELNRPEFGANRAPSPLQSLPLVLPDAILGSMSHSNSTTPARNDENPTEMPDQQSSDSTASNARSQSPLDFDLVQLPQEDRSNDMPSYFEQLAESPHTSPITRIYEWLDVTPPLEDTNRLARSPTPSESDYASTVEDLIIPPPTYTKGSWIVRRELNLGIKYT